MTDGGRAEEYCQAAERSQDRVQAYFDARAEKQLNISNQHDIDGIKQLI